MREMRAPLWHKHYDDGGLIFENEQEGVLMRLPTQHVYDDTTIVFVRALVYPGKSVEELVQFLLRSVARRPDGKVSGRKLWSGWKKWNGIDPAVETEEIAGIGRSEIVGHFRNTFNAGGQVRRRLDGDVQWVWLGYELAEAGGEPFVPEGTAVSESPVDEQADDDLDGEGARAVATFNRVSRAGTWEYEVSGGGIVNGKIYTEAREGSAPPQRLELTVKPVRDEMA